jgi:hypothetical protein
MSLLQRNPFLMLSATTSIVVGVCLPARSFSFQLPSNFNNNLAEQYGTSLYFYSEPGDYVGQGREWFYAPTDGKFSISRNFDKGVNFGFSNFGLVDFQESTWWNANFAAPFEQTLMPGFYDGATRFPFQNASKSGLDFGGDGRGCNRLGGRFDILEAKYESDGTVSSFDAVFAQYCENEAATGTPALFGRVRYNASNTDVASTPESSGILGLVGFGTLALWKRQRRSSH